MNGTKQTEGGFRRKQATHEGHGQAMLKLVERHAPSVVPPRRTLNAQRLYDLFTRDGKKALD